MKKICCERCEHADINNAKFHQYYCKMCECPVTKDFAKRCIFYKRKVLNEVTVERSEIEP